VIPLVSGYVKSLPAFFLACLLAAGAAMATAQGPSAQKRPPAPMLPGDPPLTTPTITIAGLKPGGNLKIVAYGDIRFTEPSNTSVTNPRVRRFLVDAVAAEKPDALLVTGDIPYLGPNPDDWRIFREETASWRANHLHVYPTVGNHEITEDRKTGMQYFFANFPDLQGHRFYSVRAGSAYVLVLDSTARMMAPGTMETWIDAQFAHLPADTRFVFVLLHHPLIADVQSQFIANIPGPEESRLRAHLEALAPSLHAKIVVISGHLHNYERFEHGGISYIISGGGGAEPYPVLVRGSQDLYRDRSYPNYHYLTFDIHGDQADVTMHRVADPDAANLSLEIKDRFTLKAK
jgi:hypothetical protein